MRAVRIITIILLGLFLVPCTVALLGAGIALAQGGPNNSYMLGSFMGSLLIELVVLAIMSRIFKALRRR